MVGGATPFWYDVSDKIPRPYSGPTMGQTAGGALGARVRYAKFTWSDSSDNETTESVAYGTLSVSANYLLTCTIPAFPPNVDKAWVYVGATADTYKKQATAITTSEGTWTEPGSGYDTGGDAPPSSNALSETVLVHFQEDSISVEKIHAGWYAMNCAFEELFE
jgi:hypothetical protein